MSTAQTITFLPQNALTEAVNVLGVVKSVEPDKLIEFCQFLQGVCYGWSLATAQSATIQPTAPSSA